ncbi:unnamed protein product [Rangifer tarandus platyrhynchus]|uniref:Uncharacterized protein n=1 Tax=Rangifer tarandus platyrhynchus TaxID=3082113 RepID=A0AC59YTW7_RANTA
MEGEGRGQFTSISNVQLTPEKSLTSAPLEASVLKLQKSKEGRSANMKMSQILNIQGAGQMILVSLAQKVLMQRPRGRNTHERPVAIPLTAVPTCAPNNWAGIFRASRPAVASQ